MNRREWLIAAAGTAAFPFALREARAAGSIESIDERFSLITGLGGNILACNTGAGLVLTDSGNDSGTALLDTLAQMPGAAAVHTLINTHWHREQTAGNPALGEAGARIVAHAKTHQHLRVGHYLRDEERYAAPLPAAGVPGLRFYTTQSLEIGEISLDCGYLLEAHTDGDIYVRFPEQNLIAAGDAISPLRDPMLDWFGGGWIGGRLDSLALLLEVSDAQTRFVPSYGPLVGRDYVEREHQLMTTVFDRMVEFIRMGMSAEDCIEAGVMDGLGREFQAPLAFIDATHRSLWAHHNTLSHDIV
ncbi:MAG TPA: MBL fold metallo-hydrolase [Gammaproteobacteria bacterium]|nr:MBL fold metallo-hydrolase [Gammaproteobacteria bacterium]